MQGAEVGQRLGRGDTDPLRQPSRHRLTFIAVETPCPVARLVHTKSGRCLNREDNSPTSDVSLTSCDDPEAEKTYYRGALSVGMQ